MRRPQGDRQTDKTNEATSKLHNAVSPTTPRDVVVVVVVAVVIMIAQEASPRLAQQRTNSH